MTNPEIRHDFKIEEGLYNTFYKFSQVQNEDIRFVIPSETELWPLIPTQATKAIERFGDQELSARLPVPDQADNDPYHLPVVYLKINDETQIATSYVLTRAEFEDEEQAFRIPCQDIMKILEKGQEYEEVLRLINSLGSD